MANRLTTEEVLSATTVASRQTLMRYASQGLVSAPETGVSPTGKGQALFWQPRVVQQCQKVRRLKGDGLSLAQIKDVMSRGGRRKKTIFDADPQTVVIVEAMIREVKRVARYAKDERISNLLTQVHLDLARSLDAKGLRPVLLIMDHDVRVVSEPEMAKTIAEGKPAAVMILPLASFFSDHVFRSETQAISCDEPADLSLPDRVIVLD